MPLGTLDRTPPPFFRQGPSALTRLVFFASAAVFLMAADTRLGIGKPVRAVLAMALHPIEVALLAPVRGANNAGDYFGGIALAQQEAEAARAEARQQAARALPVEQLMQENAQLRSLLELRDRLALRSHAAEVLYEAPDPYSRKIVIDKGEQAGLLQGSPVIDARGVLGQVTRLYALTAEVTLLVDRDAAIPVLNRRTQQRNVAYGAPGSDGMELRFVAANADVHDGDELLTSGLDGVYPPGLPVARVVSLERRTQNDFARIGLQPMAMADGVRHVLVIDPIGTQLPPRPEAAASSASPAGGRANPRRPMPAPGGRP
ncbi:rod shape-determining protein MreC [Leptothrix discophora]|uniref:Cell shape-determining protein MreC n=1 Tax=Leptothrix discophora TaxID=89 RepID=A0ABT9FZQ4_LEPDI|nr:rod shape-determining protein MreC [Leptothrix discophora]MDP4299713.1 rod shape-determining protein MreC [Leptothrix discophora]